MIDFPINLKITLNRIIQQTYPFQIILVNLFYYVTPLKSIKSKFCDMKDEVIVIQNHTYSTSVCPLVTKMKSSVVAVIKPVLYDIVILRKTTNHVFSIFYYTWNASSFSPSAHLPNQPWKLCFLFPKLSYQL